MDQDWILQIASEKYKVPDNSETHWNSQTDMQNTVMVSSQIPLPQCNYFLALLHPGFSNSLCLCAKWPEWMCIAGADSNQSLSKGEIKLLRGE